MVRSKRVPSLSHKQTAIQRSRRCSGSFSRLRSFWYLGLITNFGFNVFAGEPFWRVFNQMLQRLLSGRFDIDLDVIRGEGFLHNTQLVSYFGVFPALLRLPFAAFVDLDTVSLSRISCWLGLCVCAFAQLQMLWTAHEMLDRRHRRLWLLGTFAVALLLTGPQLTLTFSAYVYNEPIIWAAACAMLFFCVVLDELQNPTYSADKNYLLAALVAIAFLCRPTTGFGFARGLWRGRRAFRMETAQSPQSCVLAAGHRDLIRTHFGGDPARFRNLRRLDQFQPVWQHLYVPQPARESYRDERPTPDEGGGGTWDL